MCVFNVLVSMFCNSCGVCRFTVECTWLCMHTIDVSAGSVYW